MAGDDVILNFYSERKDFLTALVRPGFIQNLSLVICHLSFVNGVDISRTFADHFKQPI
jgi:hypothetical protein